MFIFLSAEKKHRHFRQCLAHNIITKGEEHMHFDKIDVSALDVIIGHLAFVVWHSSESIVFNAGFVYSFVNHMS